ncbi:MAG: hypothetical protein GC180_07790 [Bacteroidetes bacterium]|nr:hypothetical protein [Bacteroidota bacterium]
MNKLKVLLLALSLVSGLSAMAQGDLSTMSLQQAIDYAMKNNPGLKNAMIDVQIAQKKVKETTAMGLPQLNGQVQYQGQPVIPVRVIPNITDPNGPPMQFRMGITHSATAALNANWLIADGTYFLGLKAAKEYVEMASRTRASTEVQTRINVSQAYYMALIADATMASMDSNIVTLEKTYLDTKALYENGFAEKIDMGRLELQLNNLKIQRNKMSNQREYAYHILKFQMGMDVNAPLRLTDELTQLMSLSGSADTTQQVNYTNRPDYQVISQNQVLNNLNVRRYQMGYLPSLSAFGTYQQSTYAQKDQFNQLGKTYYEGLLWGVTLNVPIFSGFQRQAQVEQARLQTIKTRNDIKNMERAIDNEVFNARNIYETSIQTVENQYKNHKLSQEIQQIAEAKYDEGVGTSLEVTSANSDLLQAQTNYLNAVYDMLVAELNYKKSLGILK